MAKAPPRSFGRGAEEVVGDEQQAVAGQVALGGAYAPPADLELRVVYESAPSVLR